MFTIIQIVCFQGCVILSQPITEQQSQPVGFYSSYSDCISSPEFADFGAALHWAYTRGIINEKTSYVTMCVEIPDNRVSA